MPDHFFLQYLNAMTKKRPPNNRRRCCVGNCSGYTAIFYYRYYPLCLKHWENHCDNKFKYKEYRSLRQYLGLPPIEKPKGYENVDEGSLAYRSEVLIDVEQNVPVIVEESFVLWAPPQEYEARHSEKYEIGWNGIKKDPLELYVNMGDKKIVLLVAIGEAVKFSSEKAIQAAMDKLQTTVSSTPVDNWETAISKLFKKSRFWTVKSGCSNEARSIINEGQV